MPDLFTSPVVQSGFAIVVLCVLITAGFYVVSRYRDYVADDREITTDPLSKLQEMHRKGDITDEEFRTIQARTQQRRSGPIKDMATSADSIPSSD